MVWVFSQVKHLQLPTEVFVEVIGGRACKDPDCTSSTLGFPRSVSQLSPQAHVAASHPGNELHPALGTHPGCSSSP